MAPNYSYLLLCCSIVAILEAFPSADSIVNPAQQSASVVIVRREAHELGPRTWQAGVDCLDTFTRIYFQRRERLTRSLNMVITIGMNMSTPAAQIQDGFLKLMNEVVSDASAKRDVYQLRIVSDAKPYRRYITANVGLLYADYYVLIVDSVARLKSLMANYVSRMISWNPGARFLVLFNNVNERRKERSVAMAIFEEMQRHYYVHRVGLLYATKDLEYSFLVMDYYSNEPCRTLNMRRLAGCRDGRPVPDYRSASLAVQIYSNRFDYRNCTFYMCASISAPFVEEDCILGIEMRIIGFIKNRLGFEINQTCDYENRGVQEDDGNWTGLLNRLNDRDCDFILGGFYPDNDVTRSFWTSDCYLSDSHTWFVKLADPRPPINALYSIFEGATWLCFIGVLAITWLFWYLFVNMLPEPADHKELSLTAINAMAVSLCVSVNERPLCYASRIFFFVLALYGMNVTATYTSKLIAVFTDPGYLHQIDTIDEVVAAGIPFGGSEESRDWFENKDDEWIFEMYNDSHLFEASSENMEKVRDGRRVILSSRMFIMQSNISDDVYAFSKNVFSSPLQIIVKPGFPFITQFNWLIRYMRDVGIVQKIDQDFRYNNTYLNRIAKMRPNFVEDAIVLTTDHLQGPFVILVVGICSSSLVFLGELCLPARRAKSQPPRRSSKEAEKRRRREPGAKAKLADVKRRQRKAALFRDEDDDVEDRTYTVNVMRSVRFTPVKRRRIVLK